MISSYIDLTEFSNDSSSIDFFSDLDCSTSNRSRFKDLLSNDFFYKLNNDDSERDEYSINESERTIFLNDSIFESETLNSISN
jgi:hypothetical protein